MKTEKRLTMALSVLVALMMLAVPLASSSNLFVDGGQTNSNGDAPSLGAATGYTITFKLNADGKSLDVDNLATIVGNLKTTAGETWFIDESGDLCAYVPTGKKIQALINDLYSAKDTPFITKGNVGTEAAPDYAYTLNSWKTSDGKTYTYSDTVAGSDITSNMVFSAEWTLNEGFVEVPVKVTFDGETKEYVKAYKYVDDDETKIKVLASYFNTSDVYDIMGVKVTGLFVNKDSSGKDVGDDVVLYTFTAKDSSGKDLKPEDGKEVTITVANNSIILDYTLKPIYSKVTVKSIMFEEDVTLYANVGISYSYNDVFKALQNVEDDGAKIFTPAANFNDDGSVLVNNKQYKATTWNGSELLYSTNNAVADLTLDATLNSYKVVFMVNGQYEVVEIPFGELSADKCTLDVTGINRWVTTTDYATFSTFNFTDDEIIKLEANAVASDYVPQVLVAVFTPTSSTAYAVFDANDLKAATEAADFGNELVKKIVVPGKDGDSISKLSLTPELEGKNLFMGWKKITSGSPTSYSDYDAKTDLYNKSAVVNFCADWTAYESSITFNGDNSVNGVFYYEAKNVSVTNDDIISSLVAVEYDGKLYKAPAASETDNDVKKAFNDICNKVLTGSKDGYYVNQWKDADGKVVIDKVNKITLATANHAISGISVKVTEIKGDVNFYANFVPEDYLIIYYANTATASNTMVQVGTVDEGLALFGESTFGNEGYILKEWNTRPDGKGTSYTLGSDFTLNGSAYEDASKTPTGVDGVPTDYDKCVTLYAIWEKVGGNGSGNEPGNNSDGNNTDTYLLAGILAVIIILIILIAFLMRRKQ